jgi:hypothetical protein
MLSSNTQYISTVRVVLLPQLTVLPLQILKHLLLLVGLPEVPPPTVDDVQPESAV